MSMNLRLDEDLTEYIRELISSGRYSSEESVVSAAIRQMKEKSAKKAEIRRIILEVASTDYLQLIS